jgi:hypothetical protein
LLFDQPANIPTRVGELGVVVDRRVTIGPAEFIAHVVATLNNPPAIAGPAIRVVLYSVDGVPELNFVTPDPEPPLQQPAPSAPSAPDTASGGSRLSTFVRSAIAARPGRSVPPLLRGMAEALTRDLLSAIVAEPKTDEGRAVSDALAGSQIANVADLLNADPEDLHSTVLNRRNAAGLADLLNAAEKRASATAKAVGDTTVQFANNRRIVTRGDLMQPEVAAEFSKALTDALKGSVSAGYVTAAVERAANPVQ